MKQVTPQTPAAKPPHRRFSGEVVSVSGQKTVRVKVETIKMHPKYRKQYTTRKHFAVHDEKNAAQVGNVILFEECRPLSKTKRWRLIAVVK
ncbi:MAG: 30S ribosomal protein S17 [Candidatus Magasanikbacteria bacterium GW2011_GWA2_56_11]|uniref:Small ribosomal subunit protein uS17 n=1 Tax=Candidatus Magasanikbacteria bacterium GW2011_GWA2_56_11 TaxID=1619044 RepID=A0A0G2B9T8_9BACT|nr:MAG: 30S ribosomal protein S17 [Candidatus Magasanikbacteria bacterium GW2011_GWA2_56_11]